LLIYSLSIRFGGFAIHSFFDLARPRILNLHKPRAQCFSGSFESYRNSYVVRFKKTVVLSKQAGRAKIEQISWNSFLPIGQKHNVVVVVVVDTNNTTLRNTPRP
jgi:hypothetical protein